MLGKLLSGGTVTLLVAVLTVGAVSGMGGSPGEKDDDEEAVAEQDAEEGDGEEAVLSEEESGSSEEAALAEAGVSADDPEGALKIATAIADEFGVAPEEVMALHDEGIGFGALFKLYSIARAKGMTVQDLMTSLEEENGEHAWAFGKLKKSLTEEELVILEEGPKNLGELVSAASKGSEDGGGESSAESFGASSDDQGGPPAHARAKGHGKNK